ncbi:MAG: hypothetical protein HY000_04350 [Planctomycetes bacterium]|nr:hypothetical protein [Planctomycetota bacterium]
MLDQFEQWLHAERQRMEGTDLAAALRQADGERVQFLLLVRDDFWLGISCLFQALEIPLVEGQNLRLADLFDPRHARRVLQLFGQAYGCLPERTSQSRPPIDSQGRYSAALGCELLPCPSGAPEAHQRRHPRLD